MIISDLSHLEAVDSTNIVGGSNKTINLNIYQEAITDNTNISIGKYAGAVNIDVSASNSFTIGDIRIL